jgi:CDP-glycerol glycerophosphotransferase
MLDSPCYQSFTFVWSVCVPQDFAFLERKPRTRVVKRDSFACLLAFAKSKYWIANLSVSAYLAPAKDQVYLHTWHGKPIKRIGCDINYTVASGKTANNKRREFTRESRRISRLLTPAPIFTPIMASAFDLNGASDPKLLSAGYPRNALLFSYSDEDVARLKRKFALPFDKKIVLYAPTWRPTKYKTGVGYVYHNPFDFGFLKQELGEEYILLFRGHINEAQSINLERYQEFVLDMTDVMEVNDLYLVSDVLISDYSGTIFDFANLKRPMIYYLFDWNEYSNEQLGTYFDPHDFPGVVVKKQEELPGAIRKALAGIAYNEAYEAFNRRFNSQEGADAPEQVVRQLFDDTDSAEKLR